jgi:hypothetical protein
MGALELSGALMPAIAWKIMGATSAAQINRAVKAQESNSPAAEPQSLTPFRDLVLLLEHVTITRNRERREVWGRACE